MRTTRILVLLGTFLSPLASEQQPPREDPGLEAEVVRHFEYANELLGRKLYVKAIDQLLYVLALAPRHNEAHFLAGLAYIQKGLTGLEQADHHLTRAIEIDGNNPRQFHYRGVVRMRLGAYEAAVSDFRRMLAANPDYFPSLSSLGATLMRLHRYRDAEKVLKEAIAADPTLLEPRWNLRLAVQFRGGDPETLDEQHRIELSRNGVGESPVVFEDVALDSGVRRYSRARGSGWADMDGDGDLDLFTVGIRDPHALFRNDGEDGFSDVTVDSGLFDPSGGWSSLLFDYDGDGDKDIYVTRDGWDGELENSLYRNDDGIFIDVAEHAGVASPLDAFTAAVADIDSDGDLDLYVANGVANPGGSPNELFRNNGNGTFTEIAAAMGVRNHGRSIGSAFGDYDNDGWPDLLVVNFFGEPALYRNVRGGRFADVTARAGLSLPKEGFVGFFFDYNNDGYLDIFMVGFAGEMEEALESAVTGRAVRDDSRLALYRNNKDGTFIDVTQEAGLARNFGAMGASFGDIDNDGFLDIYLGCGAPAIERFEPNKLFHNQGNGTFVEVSASAGVDNLGKGHGASFADYDHDGDLDLYVPTGGAFLGDRQLGSLYRNRGTKNHWLHVKLEGTTRHRDAIGAQVRLRVGDGLLFQEVALGGGFGVTNSLILEFGLGAAEMVDEMEIRWPGGGRRILRDITADQRILVVEGTPGIRPLP